MPQIPSRTVPPWVGTLDPKADKIADPEPKHESRWAGFIRSSGGPQPKTLSPAARALAAEVYAEYDSKPLPVMEKPKFKTVPWWRNIQFLTNPVVPLCFRMFILTTSLAALVLGIEIYRNEHSHGEGCNRGTSTYLAITLDTVAIPYILFIVFLGEFSRKSGSRQVKLAILLPDLVFIIVEAVNLTLAFQALGSHDFVCTPQGQCGVNRALCGRQKGLVSVLMIALLAWTSTFVITLLRLNRR
jgi:hypothetical protein